MLSTFNAYLSVFSFHLRAHATYRNLRLFRILAAVGFVHGHELIVFLAFPCLDRCVVAFLRGILAARNVSTSNISSLIS